MDRDDSIVDRNDLTAVSVTLEPLPDGTYTVAWKNVSTLDGHRVRGSFVFSVGEPISGAPIETPDQPLIQSPWEPVLRWIILLTSLSIVGGLAFELLAWGPVLSAPGAGPALLSQRRRMGARSLKLILLAVGTCLLASLGQLVVQAQAVHDIPLAEAVGGPIGATLSDTDWGSLWLWRVGLLAALAVVLGPVFIWASKSRHDQDRADRWRACLQTSALAIGAGMLFVHSMGSHGAATAGIETPALFSDYLHLLAAAFWAGGLVHFALGAPLAMGELTPDDRRAFLSALTPRFSALAILSVGVLAITGLYSGWAQVTTFRRHEYTLRTDVGFQAGPSCAPAGAGSPQPSVGEAAPGNGRKRRPVVGQVCRRGSGACGPGVGVRRNAGKPGTGPAGRFSGGDWAGGQVDLPRHSGRGRHHS